MYLTNFRLLFFTVFLLQITLPFSVNSQEEISSSGVQVTSSELRCSKPENGTDNIYISLKIENTTNQKVSVNFAKLMWYDGVCVNCDSNSDEYTVNMVLHPNEIIEGSCYNGNNQLLIFHSMPSGFTKKTLTKYEFAELQIETLKN